MKLSTKEYLKNMIEASIKEHEAITEIMKDADIDFINSARWVETIELKGCSDEDLTIPVIGGDSATLEEGAIITNDKKLKFIGIQEYNEDCSDEVKNK